MLSCLSRRPVRFLRFFYLLSLTLFLVFMCFIFRISRSLFCENRAFFCLHVNQHIRFIPSLPFKEMTHLRHILFSLYTISQVLMSRHSYPLIRLFMKCHDFGGDVYFITYSTKKCIFHIKGRRQ